MLLLGDSRIKRSAWIIQGVTPGQKQFPPEIIKVTKNCKSLPIYYSENPQKSLLMSRHRVLEKVGDERKEQILAICNATDNTR